MKRIILTSLITFIVTSLFWILLCELRVARHSLWLRSAIKVPTRMALREINSDIQAKNMDLALQKLKILDNEWERFMSEDGFITKAVGDILVKYSKIKEKNQNEVAPLDQLSAPRKAGK